MKRTRICDILRRLCFILLYVIANKSTEHKKIYILILLTSNNHVSTACHISLWHRALLLSQKNPSVTLQHQLTKSFTKGKEASWFILRQFEKGCRISINTHRAWNGYKYVAVSRTTKMHYLLFFE